ncbi:peptide chain release factor N(5)-glutamine methyltransferase [Draconibacterium sp. IB214405]|uniref:peptide chain release factor N(5)-glutamine methyltransferase n=1 Tax=Draconibacterium sp. IB214405 TaxID=3097352 RepID=UPI002A0B9B23|nr:peptide chain release factor N(5)-glutamine methyltransferase [Draconibacterium sp. IB214405]MDX8341330.1 peptide chain release factor N(5)-glutamine methyltransferase [Draconibacterium sp. IB214405]
MQQTIQYIREELAPYYPETEISGFVQMMMDRVFGLSYTQMILEKDRVFDKEEQAMVTAIVNRLKTHEPIQYILGVTEFYGLQLGVKPGVLIPRPETEELVEWICKTEILENSKIVDIGTGSGCIALALKNVISNAEVFAVDTSEDALEVAAENARQNKLEITFKHANILKWQEYEWQQFDVIVSNPPYVRECEKGLMETNVLEHEPELALFVSDNDPLIFYRTIAEFASKQLNEGGFLFFEINEYLGDEMIELVNGLGFKSIELRRDLNNKNRMLKCKK